MRRMIDYLLNLDRRILYICLFVAVAFPFFLQPTLTIKTTTWTQKSYEQIEQAAAADRPILFGFDVDPSALAELQPMAEALLRHAFSRNVKVVGINFVPNGTALGAITFDKIAAEYNKEYGKDYVYLGFLPQFEIVLERWGDDFHKAYQVDHRQIPVADLPILKNIRNYADFQVVLTVTATQRVPRAYITWGQSKIPFNFVAGVTASAGAEYYPFLQSGQMKGMLVGMKGAAEYESLIGKNGEAMRGMASQQWGHLIIIFFIVMGNIILYLKKRFFN